MKKINRSTGPKRAVSNIGIFSLLQHIKWPVKVISVMAVLVCIAVLAFSGNSVIQAEEDTNSHKYYTSIVINPGDSLWSIASEHIDGHYSSIQDYIEELKVINNLSSDTIHAYEHLLIVYYTDFS